MRSKGSRTTAPNRKIYIFLRVSTGEPVIEDIDNLRSILIDGIEVWGWSKGPGTLTSMFALSASQLEHLHPGLFWITSDHTPK